MTDSNFLSLDDLLTRGIDLPNGTATILRVRPAEDDGRRYTVTISEDNYLRTVRKGELVSTDWEVLDDG